MKHQIKQYADYQSIYQESISNPEKFWEEIAQEFHWHKKWDTVLNWNFTKPKVEWYKNGKLNITENCLDRHLLDKSEQTAMIWEPNNPAEAARTLTYAQLHQQVANMAQVLRQMTEEASKRISEHNGEISIAFDIEGEKLHRYCVALNNSDSFIVHSSAMGQWASDFSIKKIAHDAKSVSRNYQLSHISFDTSLAAYLVNPGTRSLDFADIIERWGDGTAIDNSS